MAAESSRNVQHAFDNSDSRPSMNKVADELLSDVSSLELSLSPEQDRQRPNVAHRSDSMRHQQRHRWPNNGPDRRSAKRKIVKKRFNFREPQEYRHHVSYSTVSPHNPNKRRRLTKQTHERMVRNEKCANRRNNVRKHHQRPVYSQNNNILPSTRKPYIDETSKAKPTKKEHNEHENIPLVALDIKNIPLPGEVMTKDAPIIKNVDVVDGKCDNSTLPAAVEKIQPVQTNSEPPKIVLENKKIDVVDIKPHAVERQSNNRNVLTSSIKKTTTGRRSVLDLPMPPIDPMDVEIDQLYRAAKKKVEKPSRQPPRSQPRPPPQPFRRPTIKGRCTLKNNNANSNWGERCIDVYEIISQIGEGTYGQVSNQFH